ncbi:hypothetical protein RDWZM_010131 [Blomia tropicalis]|uniref:Notch n=1 Tax=Blomia tropicalis TaxID=40697 RepID=A0A9Q0RIF9_BLOTA|nr:hypothetical protein RDWZM_010131 [Blomia tropicalis]
MQPKFITIVVWLISCYYYSTETIEHQLKTCSKNPCFNGGTCHVIPSFNNDSSKIRCHCPLGYSATLCEIEESNICRDVEPCHNGGTCQLIENLNTYKCRCANGWHGINCTQIDHCSSQPCRNGGRCHQINDGFRCRCEPGFTGITCMDDIDECTQTNHNNNGTNQLCHNNGICINTFGSFRCNCESHFTGSRCEIPYQPCSDYHDQCHNGGTCIPNYSTLTYRCECLNGFNGTNCEINIDDCVQDDDHHQCQNGATCIDGIDSYSCHCTNGFTGIHCQTDLDECLLMTDQCRNGATCVNTYGSYRCICMNGWTGPNCSENIDDCINDPCFNGATCIDLIGSFHCQCPLGKTGLLCHLEDACASNPCHVGSICDTSPVDETYVCSCPPGYHGLDCTDDIDECVHNNNNINGTTLCEHGAQCINVPGSFHCDCRPGFTGPRCEINVNECASNPCLNDGTCLDQHATYQCVCMPGFGGTHCEINIDECHQNHCQNDAICTDLINGYRCLCSDGFIGQYCEININEYSIDLDDGDHHSNNIIKINNDEIRSPWKHCPQMDYCYEHFHNGKCDHECNIAECFFDDFECIDHQQHQHIDEFNRPFGKCNEQIDSYCALNYANGHCDYGCNNPQCGWDGFDCEQKVNDDDNNNNNDDDNPSLVIHLNVSITNLNETVINKPNKLKILLRTISSITGSRFRIQDLRSVDHNQSLLTLKIDNHKCEMGKCFNNAILIANFLHILTMTNVDSPLNSLMQRWKTSIDISTTTTKPTDGKGGINPNKRNSHSFTYPFSILFIILTIGILFGVLYGRIGRKRIAKAITWFPEGFFTHQMIHNRSIRTHQQHHQHQQRQRQRQRNNFRSNRNRSGLPDGQEMKRFDDNNIDHHMKTTIYEQPYENRHWTDAHLDPYHTINCGIISPPIIVPKSHQSLIDVPGPNGMTPLMTMISTGTVNDNYQHQQQMVNHLLINGSDPNRTSDDRMETSLHLAARYGRVDIVRQLIDSGADLNVRDSSGRTPLHTSIGADTIGVFDLLIREPSIDVNVQTDDGTTPLILSARIANQDMVQRLIDGGQCQVNVGDNTGRTALHWAVSVNNIDAARTLLMNGADCDARDCRDQTPLFLAAREGSYNCVHLLLSHGANRDITDHMDRLPRDIALERIHIDIVNLLDDFYEPKHGIVSSTTTSPWERCSNFNNTNGSKRIKRIKTSISNINNSIVNGEPKCELKLEYDFY